VTKRKVVTVSWVVLALCAATAIASAQTFSVLRSFDGNDGANPFSPVLQGTDGNLYGTTGDLGVNGGGTGFEINPQGMLKGLYSFCSQTGCADGEYPLAGLLQRVDAHFYGTTSGGGNTTCGLAGCGTVFEIAPSGKLTTLYSFCATTINGYCADGNEPVAGLVQGADGNFYGTTITGGTTNHGTVFRITPTGSLTTLHSFCPQPGCIDGWSPQAGLVQGTDGNFYGTTALGGDSYAASGGTIFKMTPAGDLATVYSFCSEISCTDGEDPEAGLVQGTDGNFYGTTVAGGATSHGTVFRITPTGSLTTLHSFCPQPGCIDGWSPEAGLVQGTDGNLYGTTTFGGASTGGTIFEILPTGELSTLYSFCAQANCADGSFPAATLVQATNGSFYGTTYAGGRNLCDSSGCGTVFSLSTGLAPFVAFVRPFGRIGEAGGILGQGFTGTTSVLLNGTSADFKVVSNTLIEATVPADATTGYVTVITPSGALSSNVPFNVIP
jgi:uncharacterized repeat protein (TIGR03803 family)